MSPPSSPSRAFLVGAVIFLVAAALRLALMQSARFGGDEARDYAIAVDIAHGHNLPLLGPSITGGRARLPGPLYNWMTAVPRLVTNLPEAGNVFFELLSAAAVWMFWLGLRRPFGEAGAAFAATLMALSPWSALLGDRVWNPHAFLFVEGLALLGVLRLRENPGSRWAIVVPCACLALPQLHMSAPVVWLALLPLAAGNVRRWNRRYLMIGIALGLLLYIPYAIHEARTGLDNTRAFFTETFAPKKKGGGPTNVTFLLTPLYALRFLTLDVSYHELTGYWGGLNEAAAWRALWNGSAARPFHPLRLIPLVASIALLLIALASGVRAALRRARDRGWRAALGPFAAAGLLAVVANLAFLGLARKQIFAHYVTLTLPFVFAIYAPLGQQVVAALRAHGGAPAGVGAGMGGKAAAKAAAIVLGLALLFGLGGIESTLTVSRRIDGRIGLGTFRLVSGRVLEDLAREGRTPAAQPVSLSFGFFNNSYAYGILSRIALPTPIRWDGDGTRFVYRVQKPEDPPPRGSESFEVTRGASATLYRLR